MKREEKNQISRQRILESAIKEFGEQGYGLSSINTICSAGGISKGILYHHFKDKDELYLVCVKETFDQLTKELEKKSLPQTGNIKEDLQRYFDVRLAFFHENPYLQKIFCETVVAPPQQLKKEIDEIKQGFNHLSVKILTSLLQHAKLCRNTTVEEVVKVFQMYQDFASIKYQTESNGQDEPEKYEQFCKRAIHVLLYGVIEREGVL